MDSRTAAHVLARIGDLLELRDVPRFQADAYRRAAKAVRGLGADDLAPLLHSGALADVPGVGPSILGVLTELIETGESSRLERLRTEVPEGLVDVLRVPNLRLRDVVRLHDALGIDSLDALEQAALDGRLATLPKIGPKTVAKLLQGIAHVRRTRGQRRYVDAVGEAEVVRASVAGHPDVTEAVVAGGIRRLCDVVRTVVVVATCRDDPARVAADFASAPGVLTADVVKPGVVRLQYPDGLPVRIICTCPDEQGTALFEGTGSRVHRALLPTPPRVPDEVRVYAAFGLPFIAPELREGDGEIEAARARRLPVPLAPEDIRGVLHVHSDWSDGTVSIADLAAAARDRGWRYIGISDHSQAAFYAGGLSPDAVRSQHAEIEALNAAAPPGFRILKGIEADILADGRLDYDAELLDRFDFVIGSVHSRFRMDREAMTARILRALDDPRLTILGHPTGRLLLHREPYAVDLEAVLTKAASRGVAVELNADPYRLDLSWRWCRRAKELGCKVAIGPDAHSVKGLDNVDLGVLMARKGWLEARDVLNTGSAAEIIRQRTSY